MNYLQRYIELRGLNCQIIANSTGYGYHSVQKAVKGVRRHPVIRTAIAQYLGLDPVRTWGRGSALYLRRMVAVETSRAADRAAEQARSKFLAKYNVSTDNLTLKRQAVNV